MAIRRGKRLCYTKPLIIAVKTLLPNNLLYAYII